MIASILLAPHGYLAQAHAPDCKPQGKGQHHAAPRWVEGRKGGAEGACSNSHFHSIPPRRARMPGFLPAIQHPLNPGARPSPQLGVLTLPPRTAWHLKLHAHLSLTLWHSAYCCRALVPVCAGGPAAGQGGRGGQLGGPPPGYARIPQPGARAHQHGEAAGSWAAAGFRWVRTGPGLREMHC